MSTAEAMPVCVYCKASITEEPTIVPRFGKSDLTFHGECREKLRAEYEAERLEKARKAGEALAQQLVAPALEWLPKPWAHAQVGTPEFARTCRAASFRRFAETFSPKQHGSALLLGKSATGKTTSVVAMDRRLIAEGLTSGMDLEAQYTKPTPALKFASKIVFATAADIVRSRRIHGLGEGDPPLIQKGRAASLLIIDEAGSEPVDRDGELFALVNDRYNYDAPTIVTSGLTSAEFAQRYGDAMLRRLIERGTKIEEFR